MKNILKNLQKIDAEITRANYNYKDGYFIDEVNKQLLADTIELVKNNVVKSNVIESLHCENCKHFDAKMGAEPCMSCLNWNKHEAI